MQIDNVHTPKGKPQQTPNKNSRSQSAKMYYAKNEECISQRPEPDGTEQSEAKCTSEISPQLGKEASLLPSNTIHPLLTHRPEHSHPNTLLPSLHG